MCSRVSTADFEQVNFTGQCPKGYFSKVIASAKPCYEF